MVKKRDEGNQVVLANYHQGEDWLFWLGLGNDCADLFYNGS